MPIRNRYFHSQVIWTAGAGLHILSFFLPSVLDGELTVYGFQLLFLNIILLIRPIVSPHHKFDGIDWFVYACFAVHCIGPASLLIRHYIYPSDTTWNVILAVAHFFLILFIVWVVLSHTVPLVGFYAWVNAALLTSVGAMLYERNVTAETR